MSFIKQFKISIYKFHDYPILLLNSGGRAVVYYLIFSLIIAVISLGTMARVLHGFGGVDGIFDKYVPEFSISDGKLICDTYDKDFEGFKVYVNTKEKFDFKDKIGTNKLYIVADSEKVVLNNGIQEITYSMADLGNFDKAYVKEFINSPSFKFTFGILSLIALFINEVIMGIGTLCMLAFAGNFINVFITKVQIKPGDLFKLSVYSGTFPVLLKSLAFLCGIQLHIIIYVGLMATYMYLGLKNIKSATGIILAEI